mmetsp:Transcript_26022/g.65590  ORF Transcript_26022/g.65590 Transcript_26022/m.65590 type:complete len:278 (-) Transcript_26022:163-996(-)
MPTKRNASVRSVITMKPASNFQRPTCMPTGGFPPFLKFTMLLLAASRIRSKGPSSCFNTLFPSRSFICRCVSREIAPSAGALAFAAAGRNVESFPNNAPKSSSSSVKAPSAVTILSMSGPTIEYKMRAARTRARSETSSFTGSGSHAFLISPSAIRFMRAMPRKPSRNTFPSTPAACTLVPCPSPRVARTISSSSWNALNTCSPRMSGNTCDADGYPRRTPKITSSEATTSQSMMAGTQPLPKRAREVPHAQHLQQLRWQSPTAARKRNTTVVMFSA